MCGTAAGGDIPADKTGFPSALLTTWKLEEFLHTNFDWGNGVGFVHVYAMDIGKKNTLTILESGSVAFHSGIGERNPNPMTKSEFWLQRLAGA